MVNLAALDALRPAVLWCGSSLHKFFLLFDAKPKEDDYLQIGNYVSQLVSDVLQEGVYLPDGSSRLEGFHQRLEFA
ncbi:hypothetical protein AHAS_Ahas15G0351900 [Arachis hypogaea]